MGWGVPTPSNPTVSPPPRAGSVVVDHEITFSLKKSNNLNKTFEETTKRLVEKLREVEATQGACQHDNCGCPPPPHPTRQAWTTQGWGF